MSNAILEASRIEELEREGQWLQVLALLSEQGTAAMALERRVECYLRMAEIYAEHFANEPEVVRTLQYVLRLAPAQPLAIERLV